jgi:HD-GYP domain-containing protein (c-di-GMP phosphodiesterase class II)
MGLSGRRYPFYITITTLMVVVVVLLAGMFLWISHRESRDAGIRTADRIFAEINEKIIAKYEGKLEAVVVLTEAASSMPGMAALPEGGETGLSGLALMFNALALHEFLFSAYVGNEKGDFLQIIAVRDQPEHRDLFSAPPGTVYALRTISTDDHGTRREHWRFESHGRRLIEERVGLDPDFDPRTRPWFVRALQGEKPVFTEPYVFMSTETPGITCAQRVPDGGVFAVDFTLERLATVFKRQRVSENGVLFLFDGQGRVILHPTMDTTILGQEGAQGFLAGMEANPVIRATVEDFQAHPGTMHHRTRELLVNGVVHLIRSASIKETLNIDQIVAAAAPLSDFTGDIQRMWKRILVFSAMALLLILPVVLFMARRMSQALVRLERESQKIQRADFSESEPFDSNIKEIHSLIQAFVLMKRTIRDYTDRLIQAKREIEALFSSITTLLAGAIDAKSPYTGGHCQRVPVLAKLLADAAHASRTGPFADFRMDSEEQRREFEVAAWLHDCGKITTPESVVDKATKLETIRNRIHEIRMRFEVLLRDARIDFLQRCLAREDEAAARADLEAAQRQIKEDFAFVAACNIGGEYLDDGMIARLDRIAARTWMRHLDDRLGISRQEAGAKSGQPAPTLPVVEHVLADKPEHIVPRNASDPFDGRRHGFTMAVPENQWHLGELYNLKIRKGTLTPEERFKINEHIIQTIIMLGRLPFPENMKNVVDIAGSHHETMIGTGYPQGLKKADMSIPARIMAIADVFEALTAADRPYKSAKPLSEVFSIMSRMRDDQHIDADLFDLFLTSGLWKSYARDYLRPEQDDAADIQPFLSQ